MTGPLRNVDQAYYGSRTPLNLQGTREGRKNPPPIPSYRQKAGDGLVSSNKYYADAAVIQPPAAQPTAVKPRAAAPQVAGVVEFRAGEGSLLPRVVQAFMQGASAVHVRGDEAQIRPARVLVDLAVGHNTLTREQADAVIFITDLPVAPVKEPVAEAPAVVVEAPAAAEEKPVVLEEALPAIQPRRQRRQKASQETPSVKVVKAEESEEVTQADVAKAFGVVEDGDD